MKKIALAILLVIGLNGCSFKNNDSKEIGHCSRIICIEGVSYLDSRNNSSGAGNVILMYNADGTIRKCK